MHDTDENLGRMKECGAKLIINELRTRTVGTIAANRDKKGRRGPAARLSVAYVAHGGITSSPSKAATASPKRRGVGVKGTSEDDRSPSPSRTAGTTDLFDENKAAFFVPSKLVNIKWPDVRIVHIVDKPTALTMDDMGADSPGKKSKRGGKASVASLTPSAVDTTPVGAADSSSSSEGEADDGNASDSSGKGTPAGSGDAELDAIKATKVLKKMTTAFKPSTKPFDEYLSTDHTGEFTEKELDVRKELRRIRDNALGRNVWGGGAMFGGLEHADTHGDVDDGRVYDPEEATRYDTRDDGPLRRDPYVQALNRELAPDLVEKFYDPKTNSVRVRRRYVLLNTDALMRHAHPSLEICTL